LIQLNKIGYTYKLKITCATPPQYIPLQEGWRTDCEWPSASNGTPMAPFPLPLSSSSMQHLVSYPTTAVPDEQTPRQTHHLRGPHGSADPTSNSRPAGSLSSPQPAGGKCVSQDAIAQLDHV